MTQKNDSLALVLTLLITVGLTSALLYFLLPMLNADQPDPLDSQSSVANPTIVAGDNLNQVDNVPQGLFNYGNSTTFAPIRGKVDPIVSTNFPNFQLRYTDPTVGNPGSGTGIKMLLNNQLAFAQSSRGLLPQEHDEAKNKGFTLKEIPIAIDGIAVAVNHDLNLAGITVEQLRDIYLGKITNWKAVGGADLPIKAYSRELSAGGTVEFFSENVLGGESFASNVEYVYSTTLGLRAVSDNLGGIYYGSAPEIVPQCTIKSLPIGRKTGEFIAPYQAPPIPPENCPGERNQLNNEAFKNGDYPITRRLFIIVKGDGSQDQIAGEKYAELLLTKEGQKLIQDAGFVPIN